MIRNKKNNIEKRTNLINLFAANVPITEKPGGRSTPTNCVKNTRERAIFQAKL